MILEINTVVGCSVACTFCPQDQIARAYRGPRTMSLELFAACIAKIPQDAQIMFSGFAEPFLNPNCAAMIRLAHQSGRPVSLYTTCVGATVADAGELQDVPLRLLCLHLADAQNHAKIDVSREYLDTIDAFAALRAAQVMTMGELHPLLEQKYAQRLTPSFMHTRAANLKGSVRIAHVGPIACGVSREQRHNVLLPNGDVALCCMDYSLDHVLGNLFEAGSYEDLFVAKPFEVLRGNMNSSKGACLCRTCECAIPA